MLFRSASLHVSLNGVERNRTLNEGDTVFVFIASVVPPRYNLVKLDVVFYKLANDGEPGARMILSVPMAFFSSENNGNAVFNFPQRATNPRRLIAQQLTDADVTHFSLSTILCTSFAEDEELSGTDQIAVNRQPGRHNYQIGRAHV